jgi:hypothetical protein
MAGTIGYQTLWNVVSRADRNRNGRLEAGDAYVVGPVAATSQAPATTDTFHMIWRGEGAVDGIRMSQADADATANELTGGRDFVDENAFAISRNAKAAMDGVAGEAYDNRISRRELSVALQWGAIAISKDGISLSQEARDYFARRQNTQAPQVILPQAPQAPQPPQRPQAPAQQYPGLTQPRQGDATHPANILNAYLAQRRALEQRWQGQTWQDGFKREERPYVEYYVNQIFTTQTGSLDDRKLALQKLYQNSSMQFAEYDRLNRQLQGYAQDIQPQPAQTWQPPAAYSPPPK